jgi:hypothetical protein
MNENLLQSLRLRSETRSGFPHFASLRKPENLPAGARKRALLTGSKRDAVAQVISPLINPARAMLNIYEGINNLDFSSSNP